MQALKRQNGFAIIEVLIVAIVVAAIAFGGWWVYTKNHDNNDNKDATQSQSGSDVTSGDSVDSQVPEPKSVGDLEKLQSTLDNASLGDTSLTDLTSQLNF